MKCRMNVDVQSQQPHEQNRQKSFNIQTEKQTREGSLNPVEPKIPISSVHTFPEIHDKPDENVQSSCSFSAEQHGLKCFLKEETSHCYFKSTC